MLRRLLRQRPLRRQLQCLPGRRRRRRPPRGRSLRPRWLRPSSPAPRRRQPDPLQHVIDQQLELMRQQLALLSGGGPACHAPAAVDPRRRPRWPRRRRRPGGCAARRRAGVLPGRPSAPPAARRGGADGPDQVRRQEGLRRASRASTRHSEELTPRQKARLEAFIRRYTERTRKSKEFTQRYRRVHADPRAVTGFRPAVKELIYPIVVERSKGPHLWDLDGNQYVDTLNGFGCNYFGWQPDFVSEAVKRQIDLGIEIGPQTPLAAEVAELFCELHGQRARGLLQHGLRGGDGLHARRPHGHGARHDRPLHRLATTASSTRSSSAARRSSRPSRPPPGILPNTAAERARARLRHADESLEILRSHADELAAVLVEPVQSRRPDFQPREFLQELRRLTEQSGSLLIFDEVITGFRTGPGGAQEHFGIKADLASYGKVVGGGLPHRRHRRQGPLHGRPRRRPLAVRRRLHAHGGRHLLRRHLRPSPAGPGRVQGRAPAPQGGGTGDCSAR